MRSTKSLVLAELDAVDVGRAMATAAGARSYAYPWQALASDLESQALGSFPCVGYGSLVNASSAKRTLGSDARALVIAFGVRRLFNLVMTDAALNRYPMPERPATRAALNVRVTGRDGDVLNGALFDVARDEIPGFREREEGYDLIPVACVNWARRRDPPIIAWILSCPDEPRAGVARTSPRIAPHMAYYRLCRDGAASRGEEFLRFWDETTFLADGTTPAAAADEGLR